MKNKLVLLIILSFSFLLYTYKLKSIPSSVYVDEATVGYNAFSVLNTGKDEFGQNFPIYFRFFGAYTPGLYVYLIIPFIKFFGLSSFSIRLLSAISGTISVFYFHQTLSLLSKKSIWGTLFYAILPWTVFNSRLGYEVMFAMVLFNVGAYYLLKGLPKISYIGILLISLSTYASHTQRYLAPIFLIGFSIIYKNFKIRPILFLFATQILNIILLLTPAFSVKNNNLSLKYFLPQIISYLSPRTLFFQLPDIDLQHQIPLISVFFWWMIIPLIIGIKKLFKLESKFKNYLILWLFCALIPASLSGEFISIQRALPLLMPLMLIISLGLPSFVLPNILLFGYSLILLLRSYFILFPSQMSLAWNYGYKELTQFITINTDKKFLIDNTRNPRNYILPLFYGKIPYMNYVNNYYSAPQIADIYSYSNMTFQPIVWGDAVTKFDYIVSDGLSVSPDQAQEHRLTKIKTITTPNNTTALEIFKVDIIKP